MGIGHLTRTRRRRFNWKFCVFVAWLAIFAIFKTRVFFSIHFEQPIAGRDPFLMWEQTRSSTSIQFAAPRRATQWFVYQSADEVNRPVRTETH